MRVDSYKRIRPTALHAPICARLYRPRMHTSAAGGATNEWCGCGVVVRCSHALGSGGVSQPSRVASATSGFGAVAVTCGTRHVVARCLPAEGTTARSHHASFLPMIGHSVSLLYYSNLRCTGTTLLNRSAGHICAHAVANMFLGGFSRKHVRALAPEVASPILLDRKWTATSACKERMHTDRYGLVLCLSRRKRCCCSTIDREAISPSLG
jgi:hypothetical protein